MFLCSGHGISYCSEFSTTTNYHAARESLCRLVASENFPKFGDFVEREETRVNSCNREKNLYFYIPHLHSLIYTLANIHFPFRFSVRIAHFVFFVSLSPACLACEHTLNSETHPRRPKGSHSGREKRQDESFQVRAKEPLGTDSHRTISKNSS